MNIWSKRVREDLRCQLKQIHNKSMVTDNDIDSIIRIFEKELKKPVVTPHKVITAYSESQRLDEGWVTKEK